MEAGGIFVLAMLAVLVLVVAVPVLLFGLGPALLTLSDARRSTAPGSKQRSEAWRLVAVWIALPAGGFASLIVLWFSS